MERDPAAGDGRSLMMRVVVLANYPADRQQSMLRFSGMLYDELASRGIDVETWHPPVTVGGNQSEGAVQKWLGYVDKYLLYPPRLSRAAAREAARSTVIHLCDHSNAIYVRQLQDRPHVVTCHDLIAVRSALGEFPEWTPRWTGRSLQRLILNGLRQASRIVCDSEATREDVRRLVHRDAGDRVIHPGVGRAFVDRRLDEVSTRTARLGVPSRFLLHVGGNQWYKNRAGLLDLYAALVKRMPSAAPLVLVGKPLTPAEIGLVAAHQLQNRMISITSITDGDLAALYSAAELLMFPSLVEGFGWPVLEAMASGCRVVASARPPMTEIGGDAATYIDPAAPESAAAIVESVLSEPAAERRARIDAGLSRAAHFSRAAMADAYLAVYHEALERRSHAA